MRKVLVTGAFGQLGSEINFLSKSHPESKFTFVDKEDLDITDEKAVTAFLQSHKFSTVINCVGYTAVDKAESDKEMAFMVNGTATAYLAKAAKDNGSKFIHISTDFIFDGTHSSPIGEDEKPNPLSVYGASKLEGEKLAFENNPDTILIRTSWVYSSYGANFVKTILKLCRERDALNIIFDQVGTPTYARDLAEAIIQIVTSKNWKPGIYNFSNEGVASWYDFAIAIRDIAGLKTKISPIETTQYPTPATRPKYSVLNKRKIKEAYNLQIPYWRESLVKCMAMLG